MSIWFRKITEEEFASFGVKFWFREWRYAMTDHASRCIADCIDEWYDVRNWAATAFLPVAFVISPLVLLSHIEQIRIDILTKGMTINHQKNIDDLKAARESAQPTKPEI